MSRPGDGQIDESYTLSVSTNGRTTITAPTALGLSYGLTTFTQLFFAHSQVQNTAYTPLAPVDIQDSPKFAHRGLNLDVARSYYPVPDILRTIDAMAYNKLNRLHLHVTDAQSWPLVIESMPELAEMGAYHSGAVYSPQAVQQVQLYGSLRGVEVFLEVDMPGTYTTSSCFIPKSRDSHR